MNRTFKERAVSFSARLVKKNRLLSIVVYPILLVELGFYYLGRYFYTNGKKYISIGVILLFFFMGSSFTMPINENDHDVYLASPGNNDVQNIIDHSFDEVTDNSFSAFEDLNETYITFSDDSANEDIANLDTFTLSDFYEKLSLEEIDDVKTDSVFDKNSWNLILVNKTNPLPDGYTVPLATIKGSMQCDERVLEHLIDMLNAASKDGISLIVCSPYREDSLQQRLFLRKINAYMSRGYSYLDAYKISSQDVIVPGTSEHQLGLAFDIVTNNHTVLDFEFGDTAAGKWLKNNCATFGFILRYPKGKEEITGIEYEPWHFRFVGSEAATYIMENELTLEEFIDDL